MPFLSVSIVSVRHVQSFLSVSHLHKALGKDCPVQHSKRVRLNQQKAEVCCSSVTSLSLYFPLQLLSVGGDIPAAFFGLWCPPPVL